MAKKRQQGKHTEQSFYDMEAISLVSAWIAETQRAMPDLKALDKWPNIDGHIEITEKDGSPKGELRAQVKKLKKGSKNKLSFRNYKFLEHCRVSIDWTPIILIGVDLENREAYWLHIDSHFLSQGGDRKTITFVENQVIKSGTSEFIKSWRKIVTTYYEKHSEFEKYKKLFHMLADVINPAYGRTDKRFVNIHYFLDELNGYLDNEFSIVKQIFYPSTWKLGLAYYRHGDSELAYTLYPIAWNRNDVQIKEINKTLLNKIEREGLDFSTLNSRNPLETNPKEYAKEITHEKTLQAINGKLLEHKSKFLANEYILAFIDRFLIPMGLELKDKYSLEEIEKAIDTYIPLWLKFSGSKRNEVAQNVEPIIQGDTFDFRILLKREIETSLVQFWEFLDYLKKSRKRKVERLYGIERRSSSKRIDHNLKIFCEHFLKTYDTVLQNNFPLLKDELSPFGKADTILVSWDLKYGSYKMYRLQAKTKGGQIRIIPITEEDIKRYELEYPNSENLVYFKGEKYQLLPIEPESNISDSIYDHTPMLNFIYKILKERIDEYFKKKEPSTKFDKHSEADEV